MEIAPPSSKRRQSEGTALPVTIRSHAMQSLFNRCMKFAKRNQSIVLVTSPDDAVELTTFARELTARRMLQDPHIVRENADSILWDTFTNCADSDRGMVVLRGDRMSETMIAEFQKLHKFSRPRKLVILNFASQNSYEQTFSSWPIEMQAFFSGKPSPWPALSQREADLHGIIDNICSQFVSDDGRRPCELSTEGRHELLRQECTSVASLLSRIRTAFDVMLRTSDSLVSALHLRVAANPTRRAHFFASATP